jgi:hypothetical protein
VNNSKKQIVHERNRQIAIIRRNRLLLKANIPILGIGLALSYFGYSNIGEPLIWLGIIIFFYAAGSSFMAKRNLKM